MELSSIHDNIVYWDEKCKEIKSELDLFNSVSEELSTNGLAGTSTLTRLNNRIVKYEREFDEAKKNLTYWSWADSWTGTLILSTDDESN